MLVVVTCIPKSSLHFKQYLGRTARMGNKGQYQVVLYDKEAKKQDGPAYLAMKMGALRNNELLKF